MSRAEERTEWRFACLIVSSLLFAALAVAVVLGVTDSFDASTRSGINRWASPNLTLLAHALSFIGSVAVLFTLTALTAAGLWLGGRPRSNRSGARWRGAPGARCDQPLAGRSVLRRGHDR